MSSIIYFAIPFFALTVLLEATVAAKRRDIVGYQLRDSAASISMGIGNVILSSLAKVAIIPLYVFLQRFAVFDLGHSPLLFIALIVSEDFCYYWFHRVHHESRLFWAAHVNHHSSTHYNLSTALRQSWTTPITGPWFWIPLVILGFPVEMIVVAQAVSLIYQYWIHTEMIGRLGPLEWILNTPSHHRVHHGRNPQYLDRNYAGILIIWDRLFGSFEPEAEPVDYGLTKNIETYNLLEIAFHEWKAIVRDLRMADSVSECLGLLLRPPGWTADGSGHTSAELRALQELAR
jgi:sterol desaturase/sphingolipid hydroxylase (fatty acid hydroxylase superfamily)